VKTGRQKKFLLPSPSGLDRLGGARHSVRAAAPPTNDGAHGVPRPTQELAKLHARLAEAEGTLRAIRNGEVDTVMVAGKEGSQIFTLEGAGHAYRVLIESMNEGALILTADKTILYANQCFARMVKCPLEQVIGGSLHHFLSDKDRAALRPLLAGSAKSRAKIQVLLQAVGGPKMPVQISACPMPRQGSNRGTVGLVVTDMTEAKRTEEMLRSLTHRVVQVQETERGRVALELHNHITQLLCAILVRSQTLANQLSPREAMAKREAIKLRDLLGHAASEVERISRHLRPSILDELGLVALMRDVCTEFAERTGVALRLTSLQLAKRLPSDIELTLYRILQLALKNVEQHARARHVTVQLTKRSGGVQMVIQDDGTGFAPKKNCPNTPNGKASLGLLSMSERASYVGGDFKIKSTRSTGTTIEVNIPLPPGAAAAKGADV